MSVGAILLAIFLVAAAAAAAILLRRRNSPASGWTAVTFGKSYGAAVDPLTGSFAFPRPPDSVRYVTRRCASGELDPAKAKGLRIRYSVTAAPGIEFSPTTGNVEGAPPYAGEPAVGPVLYFERDADDGLRDGFRWWATFAAPQPLVPGEFTIEALFSENWTSVYAGGMTRDKNRVAFSQALAEAARVGFTFGGGTGYGHGVFATGPASFEVLEFTVITSAP